MVFERLHFFNADLLDDIFLIMTENKFIKLITTNLYLGLGEDQKTNIEVLLPRRLGLMFYFSLYFESNHMVTTQILNK